MVVNINYYLMLFRFANIHFFLVYKKRLCVEKYTTSFIFCKELGLFTETKLFNDSAVTLDVDLFEVIKHSTTFTYKHF